MLLAETSLSYNYIGNVTCSRSGWYHYL